jgi:Fe2+ or Zn2+ uptake regulation protein
MTFPAELAFKRDRNLTAATRRVYDYLTTMLDFVEPRRVKGQIEAEAVGTDRETFRNALNALVEAGYLVEHPRDTFNVRVFTLAWSLPAEDR